ncbi:hypothetical protein STVA_35140 [Allostella vacuolata]|nr:hypothetical protein STVA_35140 [Stella vacuolata]
MLPEPLRLRILPARSRLPSIAAAIGTLLLSSCGGVSTRLHDRAAHDLATRLQTDFAAYRDEQPSLYAAMTSNIGAFEKEEEALVARFARTYEVALLTKAPTFTGADLRQRMHRTRTTLTALRETALDDARKDLAMRDDLVAKAKDVEAVVQALNARIAKASADAAAWDAMIVSIQQAIARLPDAASRLGSVAGSLGFLDEALARPEAGPAKTSADDNLAVAGRLKEAIRTKLADAPGIAVRILVLGRELAELERERAEKRLIAVAARQQIFQDFVLADRTATEMLAQAEAHLRNSGLRDGQTTAVAVLKEKRATGTPKRLADDAGALVDRQNAISLLLFAPRMVVGADWLVVRQSGLTGLRLARARHQESIAQSQVGDRAWQAVIASGLDGLAAYHQGGVTDEDIANLIRLAQGIALFIIAA